MLRLLADIAAPRLCPVCKRPLIKGERALCTTCMVRLPRTGIHLTSTNSMTEALSNAPAVPGLAAAWFHYNPRSEFAPLIRRAKYSDRPGLARALGRAFATELIADTPSAIEAVDVLLPVPMHYRKYLRRGYNQSEEIARGISEATGIPVGDNLVAVRAHATQTRRSRDARRKNVAGMIECRCPEELEGLDIAIVDDVFTSGATMAECALAIGRGGGRPSSVGALCLALANS